MEMLPIYLNLRALNGYNRPINCVLSARSCGKTTLIWNELALKKGGVLVYLVRDVNEINTLLETKVRETINKFSSSRVRVVLRKKPSDFYANIEIDGALKVWVFSLKVNTDKLKGIMIGKVNYLVLDEFIVNERQGNKYIKAEGFRFKEIWSTLSRENPKMKAYLFGNPYSIYNPYFVEFNFDVRKIHLGKIATNDKMAVYYFAPSPALLNRIKDENKLLSDNENDRYSQFALYGKQINDSNIPVSPIMPQHFTLRLAFKIEGKMLGVYRTTNFFEEYKYYLSYLIGSTSKEVITLDKCDLEKGEVLYSSSLRSKLSGLEVAYNHHQILYETIEANHAFERIYELL